MISLKWTLYNYLLYGNSRRNEDAYAKGSTLEKQNLKSEESHPVTDPLGENSRNPAKKKEKSVLKHLQIQ